MSQTRAAFRAWHRACRATPHSFNQTRTVIGGRPVAMHTVGGLRGTVTGLNSPGEGFAALSNAAFYRRRRCARQMARHEIAKAGALPAPRLP